MFVELLFKTRVDESIGDNNKRMLFVNKVLFQPLLIMTINVKSPDGFYMESASRLSFPLADICCRWFSPGSRGL